MLTPVRIRIGVLAAHGILSLGAGLILFYLSAVMTNPLFEAIAVVVAILLMAASLMVAAITDWFAAFGEGMKHVHRIAFYSLAGLAFALTGFFLAYYPQATMQWLVVFAAIHALAFAFVAFAFVFKAKHRTMERGAMYLFGAISVMFSGAMVGLSGDIEDRTATSLLAAYSCFVGLKLFFFVWELHRETSFARHPRPALPPQPA